LRRSGSPSGDIFVDFDGGARYERVRVGNQLKNDSALGAGDLCLFTVRHTGTIMSSDVTLQGNTASGGDVVAVAGGTSRRHTDRWGSYRPRPIRGVRAIQRRRG
jgi:hypothetical protein